MVGITLAIEREMEDARGIQDARKEDQPSSSLGKRQRTSVPQAPHVQGHPRPMTCFYCHKLGHIKRDCPWRHGSHSYRTPQSQSSMGLAQT